MEEENNNKKATTIITNMYRQAKWRKIVCEIIAFIITILKSLANPVMWLVQNSAIRARIAPFSVRIASFFSNQSYYRTVGNKPIRYYFIILFYFRGSVNLFWFQNRYDKVVIELRVVQVWSDIKLAITNQFVIARLISDQIALHTVQLLL